RLTGTHELSQQPRPLVIVGVVLFQFLVAVYGGYFGAGVGILMMSSLSLMGVGDIHRVNALKTVLAACINVLSVAGFWYYRQVVWKYALPMMVTSIIGGYLGARLSRRMNKTFLRWVVITIGFGLTAYYFWKRYASA